MKKQYKNEIKYLSNLIDSVSYLPNAFTIIQSDGKYIFGITSVPGKELPVAKILEYKTLYDTLCDLDAKVKYSLEMAIKYAYSRSAIKNFHMIKKPVGKELLAYYYIENAVFRTSSLWDILAQFYRTMYALDIPYDKVFYKVIFDPQNSHCSKFKDAAEEIHAYLIEEEDDINGDDHWKGNHAVVNEYRNKMTHRNSPNVSVASNLDFNLRLPPTLILKRVIEDYEKASRLLKEVIAKATEESRQIFDATFD